MPAPRFILISGAGPCGALLALSLRKMGFEYICLLEKRDAAALCDSDGYMEKEFFHRCAAPLSEGETPPAFDVQAGISINLVITERGVQALRAINIETETGGPPPHDVLLAQCTPVYGRSIHPSGATASDSLLHYSPYGADASKDSLKAQHNHSISRNTLNACLLSYARDRSDEIVSPLLPGPARYAKIPVFHNCCLTHVSEDGHLSFAGDFSDQLLLQRMRDHYGNPEIAGPSFVFGADGSSSAVRRARFDAKNKCLNPINTGYLELIFPQQPVFPLAQFKGTDQAHQHFLDSLHIWPRGDHMIMTLPNLHGHTSTGTLYMPLTGIDSFRDVFGLIPIPSSENTSPATNTSGQPLLVGGELMVDPSEPIEHRKKRVRAFFHKHYFDAVAMLSSSSSASAETSMETHFEAGFQNLTNQLAHLIYPPPHASEKSPSVRIGRLGFVDLSGMAVPWYYPHGSSTDKTTDDAAIDVILGDLLGEDLFNESLENQTLEGRICLDDEIARDEAYLTRYLELEDDFTSRIALSRFPDPCSDPPPTAPPPSFGALLLGDAAHAIVPFMGQGCNASLEDVRLFYESFMLRYNAGVNPVFAKLRTLTAAAQADATKKQSVSSYLNEHAADLLSTTARSYYRSHIMDSKGVSLFALKNLVEMQKRTNEPWFTLKKGLLDFLTPRYGPQSVEVCVDKPIRILSKYGLIVFSTVPYQVVYHYSLLIEWFLDSCAIPAYLQHVLKKPVLSKSTFNATVNMRHVTSWLNTLPPRGPALPKAFYASIEATYYTHITPFMTAHHL